jgi:hypothetical protein
VENPPRRRERARHTGWRTVIEEGKAETNRESEGDGARGGVTVSRAPLPHGHCRIEQARHGVGGTRSAKRGRGHLHARCTPPLAPFVRPLPRRPLHSNARPALYATARSTSPPSHTVAATHISLSSLKGRTPSFFRAQSIRRRLLLLRSPFADPFLGKPPSAPPFMISLVGLLRVAVHLGSLFLKWMAECVCL